MRPPSRIGPLAACGLLLAGGCAGRAPQRVPAVAPRKAKAVVRTARSYLPEEDGRRRTPKDCSDFVDKVFAENGIALPRTAAEMSLLGSRVKSARELRMGDLVFFSGEKVSRIVGHVGIYVGNGIFIHLSKPEVGVRMESLYSDYYRGRYITARRVLPSR
jgi:cell wall-associated NlpC family hydrolase